MIGRTKPCHAPSTLLVRQGITRLSTGRSIRSSCATCSRRHLTTASGILPTGRVRKSEWRAAMVRLRDSILYCSHCSAENFYDTDAPQKSPGMHESCWSCKKELQLPLPIRIGKSTIMLNNNTELFLTTSTTAKCTTFPE